MDGAHGSLERSGVAAAQRPAVEMLADDVGEDEVVGPGEVLPARQRIERPDQLGDERDGADLAGLRRLLRLRGSPPGAADVDALTGEVHTLPAQRVQLHLPQPGHCGGEVERIVLLVGGVADEGRQLVGVEGVTESPE